MHPRFPCGNYYSDVGCTTETEYYEGLIGPYVTDLVRFHLYSVELVSTLLHRKQDNPLPGRAASTDRRMEQYRELRHIIVELLHGGSQGRRFRCLLLQTVFAHANQFRVRWNPPLLPLPRVFDSWSLRLQQRRGLVALRKCSHS